MGRFAKEYWQQPVAVNDLGQASWQNPDYVLEEFTPTLPKGVEWVPAG